MCSCSFDVSMGGGEGRSGPSYSTGLTPPPHQALLFFYLHESKAEDHTTRFHQYTVKPIPAQEK